jgi:hypothetical protein
MSLPMSSFLLSPSFYSHRIGLHSHLLVLNHILNNNVPVRQSHDDRKGEPDALTRQIYHHVVLNYNLTEFGTQYEYD